MRAESAEFVGENLLTELAPFIFSMKDGRNSVEIRNVQPYQRMKFGSRLEETRREVVSRWRFQICSVLHRILLRTPVLFAYTKLQTLTPTCI